MLPAVLARQDHHEYPRLINIENWMLSLVSIGDGNGYSSSFASFIGSALSIVSAAAATVVAGLGYATAAAVIAAFATVFTSLEKVLQFREQWDLHRLMESELEQLRWEAASSALDDIAIANRVGEIRNKYSERMSSFRVLA
jgi:hypothetical protein